MNRHANRDFKGIWIPKDIYLNTELSWTEKILIVEIDSLDNDDEKGCYASSAHFAEFLGLSEGSVRNMLVKLKQLGWIYVLWTDGRHRGLRLTNSTRKRHKNVTDKRHKKMTDVSQKYDTEASQKHDTKNTEEEFLVIQEEKPSKKSVSDPKPAAAPDPTEVIFDAWRRILDHPAAKLDKKRRARLNSRLAEGFSVDQMLLVLQGVLRSPWHLGDNPNGIRYDKIETIYRDREQVEHFIELATARPPQRIGRQSTPHLAAVPAVDIPTATIERRPPDDSPAEHRELWRAFRSKIRESLSGQVFDTWFGPLIFDGLNVERSTFRIRSNAQVQDWLQKYYAEKIYDTFVAIGCGEFTFEWELEDQIIYEEAA